MKRFLALTLAVLMLLTMTACGKEAPKEDTPTTTADTTTTTAGDATDTTGGDTITEGDATTTTGTADDGTSTTTPTKTGAADTTNKTSATKQPTATAGKGEEGPAIRVLAIGDGYTADAMERYLYDLFKVGGYATVHLGILQADGATLDAHYTNVKGDKAAYQYRENKSGKWTTPSKAAPSAAFKAAKWDYVILQQSGTDAGKDDTFGNLSRLTELVQKQCPSATLKWHMTWAYRQGAVNQAFAAYKYNQQLMYQSIVSTALKRVMGDPYILGLIPTGTTVQNLRTSSLKKELTDDDNRLRDTYGDYAAALTWYCCLAEESAADVTYRPAAVKDKFDEIAEAVDNALSVPNQTTPAAKGDGEHKSIRILAVGNSFSIDAVHNHLYGLLEGAGYDEIRLGILYVGGCSVDMHYNYLKNDSASYEYLENIGGKWTNTKEYKASDAFALCDWDFVTVQQVSGYAGIPSSYGNLDPLMDLITAMSGDAEIYWQMTWAYQKDSTHSDFGKFDKDQMTMYNAIVSTVKEKIKDNPDFDGILPSGTAIQNLRTSTLGDTLTADGYHLENAYGDYTAAMTWFCVLTGEDAFSTAYCPASVADHYHEITEAVNNAVDKPFEVTATRY